MEKGQKDVVNSLKNANLLQDKIIKKNVIVLILVVLMKINFCLFVF